MSGRRGIAPLAALLLVLSLLTTTAATKQEATINISISGRQFAVTLADNDTLTGGAGRDVFLFDARLNGKSNVDVIVDFRRGQDAIQLKKSVFKKLGSGAVKAKNFRANASGAELDRNDYLVYNTKTSALLYDRDGKGGAAAVQFAVLKNKTRLQAADFLVAA